MDDHFQEMVREIQAYIEAMYGSGVRPISVTIRLNTKKSLKLPLVPCAAGTRKRSRKGGEAACRGSPETRHGPDFRSACWFGETHAFSEPQARVVAILWEAWENGTPDVGDRKLLHESGSQGDRLADVFRGCSAWGTMIRAGRTKGSHRLAEPGESVEEGPDDE